MSAVTDELLVRDVMTSPVIESKENETAEELAKKMMKYGVGAIIVTDSNDAPVGIITKTDLVEKVVSRNVLPSKVHAREIMSAPLYTIDPEEKIETALRKMTKLKVGRLVVTYKGRLVGIVSVKDILQVTPELLEIVKENMRIRGIVFPTSKEGYVEGYCDSCGEWSDMLLNIDGQYLCEECRLELIRRTRRE